MHYFLKIASVSFFERVVFCRNKCKSSSKLESDEKDNTGTFFEIFTTVKANNEQKILAQSH